MRVVEGEEEERGDLQIRYSLKDIKQRKEGVGREGKQGQKTTDRGRPRRRRRHDNTLYNG